MLFLMSGLVVNALCIPSVCHAQHAAPQSVAQTQATPWLSTAGNHIVTPDGTIWQGRGANIQDTRSCWACAETPNVAEAKRRVASLINDWGATFIRLTMETYDHHQNVAEDASYLAQVAELVHYIGTWPHTYVLLSLWHDPSLNPNDGFPSRDGHKVWETLVDTFHASPHVMFGISNEPMGHDGARDAEVYQYMNETVDVIRHAEAKYKAPAHLISVQGTRDYARHLTYYIKHPITAGGGKNIIYETHIYDRAKDFPILIEIPAKTLPVIIGEFGPRPDIDMTMPDCEHLLDLAERLQISWLAWNFHHSCGPDLLEHTNNDRCGIGMHLRPSAPWGTLIQTRLLNARAKQLKSIDVKATYKNHSR